MIRITAAACALLAGMGVGLCSRPEARSTPVGEPVLEPPTLRCLGVYWIVRGDENRNARVDLDLRAAGSPSWRKAMPLFRVEQGAQKHEHGGLEVPPDAWLFAGSAVMLQPGTSYELRVRLTDPDGGEATRTLSARTLSEPSASAPLRTLHVATAGKSGGHGFGDRG